MIYKPFSVVVVPFPFTESANIKKRPAIVLSSEEFQKASKHISLLMITSAKHSTWLGDNEIINLKEAGLNTPSIMRQKIFTLDNRLILNGIGKLSLKDKQSLIKSFQWQFKQLEIN